MAQDLKDKRRRLAENAVIHATRLVDALLALEDLKAERAQAGNFDQAEFDDTSLGFDLKHLTPGIVGTLFDFVIPDLLTAYTDAGNAGRAKQILLQMRR